MYTQPRKQIIARPAGESDEESNDDDLDDFGFDMPGFRNKKVNNPVQHSPEVNGVNNHTNGSPANNDEGWDNCNSNPPPERSWLVLSPIEELRIACTRGNQELVEKALSAGDIPVDYLFEDGYSPLMEAAAHGHLHLVEYLVNSKQADPNLFHFQMLKITAVMAAVSCSDPDKKDLIIPILKVLIEQGHADVNRLDKYGNSALAIAVKRKLFPVVQYLLSQGADPNLPDNTTGRTCLFHAAEQGSGKICRLLLEHNADIYLIDDAGWSIPELANDKGHFMLSELLHIVRDTKWSPGLNPTLIQEIDDTVADRVKERIKDGFSVKEDSQLELLLNSLNAEKYIEVFRKHKVSYVQFLMLDEDHLKEMGVDDVGLRLKLVEAIRETHNTRWANSSLNMVAVNKKVTAAEAVCIVENIKTHLDHISSTLRSLRNRIAKDPKNLRLGKEIYKIQDLTSFTIQMRDSNEVLEKDADSLLKLFMEIEDFAEFKLGDEMKPKSVEEFISLWRKKKMTKKSKVKTTKNYTLSTTTWKTVTFGFGGVAVVGVVSAYLLLWKSRGK